jgi:hypothetical protein
VSDDPQTVRYFLPLTVAKIEGSVTVSTAATGVKVPVRTSKVSLATEADRQNMRELALYPRFWEERAFGVKLTADERLTGASHSSTGLGAEIVTAGLRVAGVIAQTAALLAKGLPAAASQPAEIEEVLQAEQPDLAERRKAVAETLDLLESKLLAVAKEIAEPDPAVDLRYLLDAVQAALTAARAEAQTLESQFDEWRAGRFPDWTTSYSYTLGVDRMPDRPSAEPELRLAEKDRARGQVAEIMDTLGVVVVRIADEDPTQHSEDRNDQPPETDRVHYRLPRRCQLAVYEIPAEVDVAEGQPPPLHLRRLMPAWIVDSRSEVASVRFESDVFKAHGAGVEFGDGGTLVNLTNKETGAASAITTVVSGATGAIAGSVGDVGKIAAVFPTDPELQALQDQVSRKELEAKLVTAKKTIAGAGNGHKPEPAKAPAA